MAAPDAATSDEWLATPGVRRWAFTAPQLAFLVGFVLPVAARAVVWPAALCVIGVACVANARRCGRLHCYFTGPFFLLSAAVLVAYAFEAVSAVPGGWDGLRLGIVALAAVLNVVPERLWGRYRPAGGAGD